MEPIEIKIEFLRKSKISMSNLANELGVTPTAIHRVINRQSISERVQRAIAESISLPVEHVFPERQKGYKKQVKKST